MSIPTSLIIVVLVAAWLTVLVPMVARRREAVPETDTDGGSFRVLRRASASIRRRPTFRRRAEVDQYAEDLETDGAVGDDALDEVLLDNEHDPYAEDEFDGEPDDYEDVEYAEVTYEEVSYEEVTYEDATVERDGAVDREPVAVGASSSRRDRFAGVDESHLRPVPRRHGRGGYDPDAAEVARAYKYSRRRRITVVLFLATVAFGVAAYFVKPVLWSGTGFFGLLLVAYLGYLRRAVRIENDIRQRRLARLRRARQIRPEYHLDRLDEPVVGSSFGRPEVAVSQVPPSGYRHGREIVDLEDDDPSFDDLDYYQPIVYRRASGQ
ncbi:hypothetical protein SAMN04515671_0662 [Nakamurella panacisegetis]|uniref:Transmembrane protein n=1 Tax=Nakamurella panacisegetis TaxID=1090615 RepID=A0A1H0IVY7_9ACTN|nr:gephyrin-like molybdotransferase receptor GlpR [Nakamurella panacisegetis]SDO35221.1 hypothetical protein SAMN04515671_0662 [Nakamurella panacisegetis]